MYRTPHRRASYTCCSTGMSHMHMVQHNMAAWCCSMNIAINRGNHTQLKQHRVQSVDTKLEWFCRASFQALSTHGDVPAGCYRFHATGGSHYTTSNYVATWHDAGHDCQVVWGMPTCWKHSCQTPAQTAWHAWQSSRPTYAAAKAVVWYNLTPQTAPHPQSKSPMCWHAQPLCVQEHVKWLLCT